MARILWPSRSEADLERHYHFLAVHNPRAAANAIDKIIDAANVLADMPYIGVVLDEKIGLRKWPVFYGKYGFVIHYQVIDNTVNIAAVFGGRENRLH